ncbi:DUF5683 domain-containing protein [Aegicerativicinus sediminis]|uniref:DUF5683 domain-containing protein n=1 Tax=Aegicerativicinus sediminis TaxID=2893202 RepID=UPI001E55F61C|nr:DUF5683 domain-containing protein [Aegicerativicinus sediminis]
MPKTRFLNIAFLLLIQFCSFAQEENDSITVAIEEIPVRVEDSVKRKPMDPLSPSRAAFYSAVLPGLGQAYNGRYWKIPIVWGAIGTGVAVFSYNNKLLNKYRDAYKRRLAGYTDDEYWGVDDDGNPLVTPRISEEALRRAQKSVRRNKDISLMVTLGLYALNIIDANVDAHLLQYNVDENLAVRPHIKYNELEKSSDVGLSLSFKF